MSPKSSYDVEPAVIDGARTSLTARGKRPDESPGVLRPKFQRASLEQAVGITNTSGMGFKNGRCALRDRYRGRTYQIPPGQKRHIMLDGSIELRKTPGRRVSFGISHFAAIDDPGALIEMFQNRSLFEKLHGFHIEQECLPNGVAEVWDGLHLENKRAVAIALAQGATSAQALECVNDELQKYVKAKEKAETPPPKPDKNVCKVCGEKAVGTNPQAALIAHYATMHPDYEIDLTA